MLNKLFLPLLLLGYLCSASLAQVLRVGFAYTSPREDVSWTFAIENARQQIEADYPDVFTEWTVIDVPASQTCPAPCLANIRAFAARGFDLVVLGGQAFYEVDHIVAAEFPNTWFVQISRAPLVPHEHVAWFSAFIEQTRFLSGVTAGLMTKTNEVGYVTVNRLQPVLRQFNAWYFGVKKVNPNAKVYLISGNAFGNATADRIAAEYILNISNADVLSFQSLYAEVSRVACERGLFSTGYGSDIRKFVGDSVLTSAMWNWVPALHYFIDKVAAGTMDDHKYDGTLTTDSIRLAEFSPYVNQSVRDVVNTFRQQVIDGTELMFCGPMAAYLSNGAVPPTGCMNRDQQTAVNKVPSSEIDPGFTDLGNVDLSRPASTPLQGCWTPPVVPNLPVKACVRSVSVSQTRQNIYTENGVTYSQWAVTATSSNPLYASLEFSVVPPAGSTIQSAWGVVAKGNNVYASDDWRFAGAVRVPAGTPLNFYYIVSSANAATITSKNATCVADCKVTATLTPHTPWSDETKNYQMYDIGFTNTGFAVSESLRINFNIASGTTVTSTWGLSYTGTGNSYTVATSYLAPGQSNPSLSGITLATPKSSTPQTPSFTVDTFVCK
jgi:basic membrane protein A